MTRGVGFQRFVVMCAIICASSWGPALFVKSSLPTDNDASHAEDELPTHRSIGRLSKPFFQALNGWVTAPS